MKSEQEIKYCHKLIYEGDNRRTVLYGIIQKQDEHLLYFKTAKKEYVINRRLILSLEETSRVFISELTSEEKSILEAKPITRGKRP